MRKEGVRFGFDLRRRGRVSYLTDTEESSKSKSAVLPYLCTENFE